MFVKCMRRTTVNPHLVDPMWEEPHRQEARNCMNSKILWIKGDAVVWEIVEQANRQTVKVYLKYTYLKGQACSPGL